MKTVLIIVIILLAISSIVVVAKYTVFRLGKAVNEKISDSYYYHSIKNIIVYAPAGNWFELDYVELEADKDSFQPIAKEFGKDDASVFWRGKKQAVDYTTFTVDKDRIARDAMHVYSTNGYGKKLSIIEGANPKTYHRFDTGVEDWNRYWGRDDAHYFYLDKIVDADYHSFKRINNSIAIDTNSVYAIINKQVSDSLKVTEIQEVVRKVAIPQGTAKAINGDYALIGNAIILSNWKTEFVLIPFTHIDSMRVIDERNIVVNNQLISDGKLYPEIDVVTFTILQRDYFKDKNQVYFDGQRIEHADPKTFEILNEDYSKDNQHVFYKNQKVEQASPATFTYDFATGLGTDGNKKFKEGKLTKTE